MKHLIAIERLRNIFKCTSGHRTRGKAIIGMALRAIKTIFSKKILIIFLNIITTNYNEFTHSAEPSPQVWFGKQVWYNHWQENNCRQYLTVIIITIITIITLWLCYICVCVWLTTYTSTPTSRRAVLKSRLEKFRKQFGGFNDVEEMKWAELEINRKLWASSKL